MSTDYIYTGFYIKCGWTGSILPVKPNSIQMLNWARMCNRMQEVPPATEFWFDFKHNTKGNPTDSTDAMKDDVIKDLESRGFYLVDIQYKDVWCGDFYIAHFKTPSSVGVYIDSTCE